MATFNSDHVNDIIKAAKVIHNGRWLEAFDTLTDQRPFIPGLPMMEATGPTDHYYRLFTSRNHARTRSFGEGYTPTTSDSNMQRETMGNISASTSVIDDRTHGMTEMKMIRMRQEAESQTIKGIMDDFSDIIMYGDLAEDARQIKGLTQRFNKLESGTPLWQSVFNAGDSSNLCSIWIAKRGGEGLSLLHPEGDMNSIIRMTDRGSVRLESAGKQTSYLITDFDVSLGICLPDTRCVKRICNIDAHNPTFGGSSADSIEKLMIEAINNLPDKTNAVIAMPRRLYAKWRIYQDSKANVQVPYMQFGPAMFMTYENLPVFIDDTLKTSETQVA